MADTQLFINGEWTAPQSGETFPTYAPSTGEKIADVAKAGREDAQRAIQAARDAFDNGPWPKMSGKERAEKLRKVSELITARSAEIAESEVKLAGFSTAQLPAAIAGAIFQPAMRNGKFHGTMPVHTP